MLDKSQWGYEEGNAVKWWNKSVCFDIKFLARIKKEKLEIKIIDIFKLQNKL